VVDHIPKELLKFFKRVALGLQYLGFR